jgi:hypothetical protein
VSFDPLLLSFESARFGKQLDILGLGSIQSMTTVIGSVNLFELSLDSTADLNSLQLPSFTLTTLTFNTSGVGTSALTLTLNALANAEGQPLGATVNNGSITVRQLADNQLPEPATFGLVAAVLLLIAAVVQTRIHVRS